LAKPSSSPVRQHSTRKHSTESLPRTPLTVGGQPPGTLVGLDAFQLAEVVLAASLKRSGVPVAELTSASDPRRGK
jgi:hypothetical protein